MGQQRARRSLAGNVLKDAWYSTKSDILNKFTAENRGAKQMSVDNQLFVGEERQVRLWRYESDHWLLDCLSFADNSIIMASW